MWLLQLFSPVKWNNYTCESESSASKNILTQDKEKEVQRPMVKSRSYRAGKCLSVSQTARVCQRP